MKYRIGDKVELKDGSIVVIEEILNTLPYAYGYGHPLKICLPEEDIVRKIEE